MGEFLSLSGVIGRDNHQTGQALATYAANRNGEFSPKAGGFYEEHILVMAESGGGSTILYPGEFFEWDDASAGLSRLLGAPVFSLHIHDGDLWMFILFVDGEPVAHFNPMPDYWDDDISEEERELWKGDAERVARYVPSVKPESIERYFVAWTFDDDLESKAYPDDEFEAGDCWQMADFIKRLGLPLPLSEEGEACGTTFHFKVKSKG